MNSMVDLSIVFCKRLPESIPNWSTISRHFNLTRWGPNRLRTMEWCPLDDVFFGRFSMSFTIWPIDLFWRKLGGFPLYNPATSGKRTSMNHIHPYPYIYIHICKTWYKRSCDRLIHLLWLVHPFSSVRCYHGVSVQGGSQGKQGVISPVDVPCRGHQNHQQNDGFDHINGRLICLILMVMAYGFHDG